MEPTKYQNLYRTSGVFRYIYKKDNFEIGARDWSDLKFKLAINKIKLQEKAQEQNNNIYKNISKKSSSEKIQESKIQDNVREPNKNSNKKINNSSSIKKRSNDSTHDYEPLRKNIDYIESEEDVGFGKDRFNTILNTHYRVDTWGPDNSKRARKLRENLIK